MAKLLQIGIVYPNEMRSGIGHVACTLGGVNYESRGGRGCLKGSAARGAAHPLFKHRFHRVLTDVQATAAKEWADRCVGLPTCGRRCRCWPRLRRRVGRAWRR